MTGFANLDIGKDDIWDIFNGNGELAARWAERWMIGMEWYYGVCYEDEL